MAKKTAITPENIELNVVPEAKSLGISHTHSLSVPVIVKNVQYITWARDTETAIIPTKEDGNSGFDLYADLDKYTDNFVIEPFETRLVSTGVRVAMPETLGLQIKERGSTGSIGMKVSCGVVDSNYRGTILVALYNGNNKTLVISKSVTKIERTAYAIYYPTSKAIAQGVFEFIPVTSSTEVSLEDFLKLETNRGEGKLGSSGK